MLVLTVVQLAVWLLAMLVAPTGIAQEPQRGPTRSPHGQLSLTCERCHTFTSWIPIRSLPEFDHNRTRYPLRGLHKEVTCRLCHLNLVFTNVGTKCADCHADIHRRQFGAKCEECHTVKGWRVSLQAVKDHQNRFPLVGAHAAVECVSCHREAAVGQFQGLTTDCVACHLADYQQTTVFDHRAANLSTNCEGCHTMDSWFGARFDHARFTGFALLGAHANLTCAACHTGGRYQGTSANCFACHSQDYSAARNPNHVSAAFPTECSLCHTTSGWTGARFDHDAFTRFPLTGAHVNVPCQQCHVNNRYAGTPKDCASCHLTDYNKTTDPNHVSAGFPQDCSICHSTAQWDGARFDHSSTQFPLTGAHVAASCSSCHVNGNYANLSTSCVSCHLSSYTNTTDPNHAAAGFPQDCALCHTTSAWVPASFDHSRTAFPLTGAHQSIQCASCHIGGRYAGTPTDCYSCHRQEYSTTTDPNHAAAGFPTTCSTCHSTSSWLGASFNHVWFPIYSGKHAHKWTTCADCHINSNNYAVFSCTTCHAHERTAMDDKHREVRGYVYNSSNCYSCHPTGSE